jgi:hypothetical protein
MFNLNKRKNQSFKNFVFVNIVDLHTVKRIHKSLVYSLHGVNMFN